MISISGAVTVVVYLIVAGLVFWLLYWLLNYVNPPEPFKKVANIVLTILAVLVIITMLLSLVNGRSVFVP